LTVGEVLRGAADYLAVRGVPSPRVDAELLLAHTLGLERIQLYTEYDRPLTDSERAAARDLLRRRGQRQPLAYVLGEWGFRRLILKTDARALVPRPETEVVVDRCLALLDGLDEPRVLDVGTGTGAIALSIAQEHPSARVTATDVSADALALARENAERLGLTLELREGDLLAGATGPFVLVVSNPPYIPADELAALEPEVRDHEPRLALLDEQQTARLADEARAVLDGWLVLEAHEGHANGVAARLEALSYGTVRISPDLAGRPRVVEARWRPTTTSSAR
jgi:release factor glutamine methyltransferase